MLCGVLYWILEQKKDMNRETGETQERSFNIYQCKFLSFDNGCVKC